MADNIFLVIQILKRCHHTDSWGNCESFSLKYLKVHQAFLVQPYHAKVYSGGWWRVKLPPFQLFTFFFVFCPSPIIKFCCFLKCFGKVLQIEEASLFSQINTKQ